MSKHRDHGGGVDAAAARYGGERSEWIDLSTGINPVPYDVGQIPPEAWQALPDAAAQDALIQAARSLWNVPRKAAILAAPGASSLIARLPALWPTGRVRVDTPTYNEHAGAFENHGWMITPELPDVQVVVHPNNPDGRLWRRDELNAPVTIIDESFADIDPALSHMDRISDGRTIILKSFGKFWGLAGLRLGFAIGAPELIDRLGNLLGPWAVSGPALHIATRALEDHDWINAARIRIAHDSDRIDHLMQNKGIKCIGGTSLFRLYDTENAQQFQRKLAEARIWSRIFPYSDRWVRLGLPAPDDWERLEDAI